MVQFTRQRLRSTQPRISRLYHQPSIERCPSCGKGFANRISVLKHLNHPKSKCSLQWFPSPSESSQDLDNSSLSQSDESLPPNFTFPDHDPDPPNSNTFADYTANDYCTPFCETFPGASAVFGQGKTFLDRFDEDEHAPKRQTNLFYPFACEAEWELASFLHHSSLSTKAIDLFFSLQIVSSLIVIITITLLTIFYNRSVNYQSHFDHLRTSVLVWSYYPRLPSGAVCPLWLMATRQKHRCVCTIGTHLSVWSTCLVTPCLSGKSIIAPSGSGRLLKNLNESIPSG